MPEAPKQIVYPSTGGRIFSESAAGCRQKSNSAPARKAQAIAARPLIRCAGGQTQPQMQHKNRAKPTRPGPAQKESDLFGFISCTGTLLDRVPQDLPAHCLGWAGPCREVTSMLIRSGSCLGHAKVTTTAGDLDFPPFALFDGFKAVFHRAGRRRSRPLVNIRAELSMLCCRNPGPHL